MGSDCVKFRPNQVLIVIQWPDLILFFYFPIIPLSQARPLVSLIPFLAQSKPPPPTPLHSLSSSPKTTCSSSLCSCSHSHNPGKHSHPFSLCSLTTQPLSTHQVYMPQQPRTPPRLSPTCPVYDSHSLSLFLYPNHLLSPSLVAVLGNITGTGLDAPFKFGSRARGEIAKKGVGVRAI